KTLGGGSDFVKFDILDKLGGYTFDGLKKVDPGTTLTLDFPDGRHAETMLPPVSFRFALKGIFEKIEKGAQSCSARSRMIRRSKTPSSGSGRFSTMNSSVVRRRSRRSTSSP